MRRFCLPVSKVFENLVEVQKELSLSVQEVTKLQKTYKDEEHLAHDARVKAAEADDKYATPVRVLFIKRIIID